MQNIKLCYPHSLREKNGRDNVWSHLLYVIQSGFPIKTVYFRNLFSTCSTFFVNSTRLKYAHSKRSLSDGRKRQRTSESRYVGHPVYAI